MNALPIRKFVLSERGHGVSCDASGAFIDSIPLLEQTPASGAVAWQSRDPEALSDELSMHFGLPIDMSSKASALNAIAEALSNCSIARAQLVTLHMQFPDPPSAGKGRDIAGRCRLLRPATRVERLSKGQPQPQSAPLACAFTGRPRRPLVAA